MNCYQFQYNLFFEVSLTFEIFYKESYGDGDYYQISTGTGGEQNTIKTLPASENMPRGFMVCPTKFSWWGDTHSWARRGLACSMFGVQQHYFSNQKIVLNISGKSGGIEYDYNADFFIGTDDIANENNFGLFQTIPIAPWDNASPYYEFAKAVFEKSNRSFGITLFSKTGEGTYFAEFDATTDALVEPFTKIPIYYFNGTKVGEMTVQYTVG